MSEELLKAFLSTDTTRSFIPAPIVQGHSKYYTDGRRIAVCVVTDEPETDGAPDVSAIFARATENITPEISWSDWPKREDCLQAVSEREWCESCGGTGEDVVECKSCAGVGKTECHACGHDIGCEDCSGLGSIPIGGVCEVCEGRRRKCGNVRLHVIDDERAVYIRPKDFARITALPDVRLLHPVSNEGVISFVFDGGRGVFIGAFAK